MDWTGRPRRYSGAALVVGIFLLLGLLERLLGETSAVGPRRFDSAGEVIRATIEAAANNDTPALRELFGLAGKDIVESGNAQEDKEMRAEFAKAAREKLLIDERTFRPGRVGFSVGVEDWPFPVPVVKVDGKWQLDAVHGRLEILARRIGRNELSALEVLKGYTEAQIEYSSGARDADHVLKYAQQVVSSAGKQDGLYSADGTGSLVGKAFAQATVGQAFHGYLFRVLKSQGPHAPGGAFDYVVKGKMIGGFALFAWPAHYGVSGVRSFLINHTGVIFEKDLGPATELKARQVMQFNPDATWREVVLD